MPARSVTTADVRRVGFLPRFAAEILDIVAVWVLVGIVGGTLWGITTAAGAAEEIIVPVLGLAGLVLGVGYWTLLHAHGRQTLGKRMIGAVVTDTALRPIGYGRALLRLIAELASTLPFYLGYLWPLWDPERQTFHDKLAGTLVVHKDGLPRSQG